MQTVTFVLHPGVDRDAAHSLADEVQAWDGVRDLGLRDLGGGRWVGHVQLDDATDAARIRDHLAAMATIEGAELPAPRGLGDPRIISGA